MTGAQPGVCAGRQRDVALEGESIRVHVIVSRRARDEVHQARHRFTWTSGIRQRKREEAHRRSAVRVFPRHLLYPSCIRARRSRSPLSPALIAAW